MNRKQWQQRYDSPVRLSLDPARAGSWDHERLFVPEMHAERGADVSTAYDQHMEHRQAQIRGATGPDRERAELMERAERSGMQHYNSAELAQGLPRTSVGALEARQDLMQRERSMAKLIEHDRSHAHPMVQDPQRAPESATWDEKRQWAERDGRRLGHEERVTLGNNGAFDPFRERQDFNTPQRGQPGRAGELVTSFAIEGLPEPVTGLASLVADAKPGRRSSIMDKLEQQQPQATEQSRVVAEHPPRRSALMDKLQPPQRQSEEQTQSASAPEQSVRRSPMADLLRERMSQRPAPAPSREREQGVSMGW